MKAGPMPVILTGHPEFLRMYDYGGTRDLCRDSKTENRN
jgi:hypothetical protein